MNTAILNTCGPLKKPIPGNPRCLISHPLLLPFRLSPLLCHLLPIHLGLSARPQPKVGRSSNLVHNTFLVKIAFHNAPPLHLTTIYNPPLAKLDIALPSLPSVHFLSARNFSHGSQCPTNIINSTTVVRVAKTIYCTVSHVPLT